MLFQSCLKNSYLCIAKTQLIKTDLIVLVNFQSFFNAKECLHLAFFYNSLEAAMMTHRPIAAFCAKELNSAAKSNQAVALSLSYFTDIRVLFLKEELASSFLTMALEAASKL